MWKLKSTTKCNENIHCGGKIRKHIINKHIRLGGGDCQDPCKFSVLDRAALVFFSTTYTSTVGEG